MADVMNLDAMTEDELMAFWHATSGNKLGSCARKLFPDHAVGRTRAVRTMRAYALAKATAIGCRLRGNVADALRYEALCEQEYRTLPQWARW